MQALDKPPCNGATRDRNCAVVDFASQSRSYSRFLDKMLDAHRERLDPLVEDTERIQEEVERVQAAEEARAAYSS